MEAREFGVQSLVAKGLNRIPDIYIRPEEQRPILDVQSSASIPVIDLTKLHGDEEDRRDVIKEIGEACREWGFFQITNHGVPYKLMEDMMEVSKKLFAIPLEEKRVYHTEEMQALLRFGTSFNPSAESVREWHDYFQHYFNPSPDEKLLPANPPSYRTISKDYGYHMATLAKEILGAILESLGVAPTSLDGPMRHQMRINYFPPCPDPNLTLGISGHSDPGLITILFPDQVPGLGVLHEGRWVPVKPLPNAFIINLADQFQVYSNDKYQSIQHRVTVNAEKTRYSIATFFAPALDAWVAPFSELVSEDQPATYKGYAYIEYLKQFLGSRIKGKSLVESLKISSKNSSY